MSEHTINININLIDPRLDEVVRLLRSIIHTQENEMAAIDDLIADAQDESTVDDSIIALLTSISGQLAAAGNDPAKLAQLKSIIDANKAKIAAAVAAGTPAAPADTTTGGTGTDTTPGAGA